MKRSTRILLPIILAIVILLCMVWYLFIYDRAFTRDVLLSCARFSENQGNHAVAAWFYNRAYDQASNNEDVAIELAEQYKRSGNFTKAEYTLSNAIADGGGVDVYIALCRTYVEQDKLLDAVNMLNNISNPEIRNELDAMRPAAPSCSPEPGFYSQYISVTLSSLDSTLYASTDGEYPSVKDAPYSDPIPLQDGENTIYAIAIAKNSLVSPLSVFGYTVGGVIEKMSFTDQQMEEVIRTHLNVSAEKELYTNDLWQITEFTVPSNAADYGDLKHMPFLKKLTIENGVSAQLHNIAGLSNLEELLITDTTVTQEDLSAIAALPQLKKLTLQNCGLSSVAPLEKAVGLNYLDLSNNTIRSIEALAATTALTDLYLQHNIITSLGPLSANTTLIRLDVSHNSLSSLASLSGVATLDWINADTNSITELGKIGKLSELTHLSVSNNQLTDISDVRSCTKLTNLNVSNNKLTGISATADLLNLMYLDFSYNEVVNLPNFEPTCALVTITGTKNKLQSLDPLGGLEHLNNVHMDYNESISSVSALADCHNLIEVNVYGTLVTDASMLTDQSIIVNYTPVQ